MKGMGIGTGIGMGTVLPVTQIAPDLSPRPAGCVQEEMAAFDRARETVQTALREVYENPASPLSEEEKDIFRAHEMMLMDDEIRSAAQDIVKEKGLWISSAVKEVFERYRDLFASMEDEYMRARSADCEELCNRMLCALQGIQELSFSNLPENSVLAASDFTPSALMTVKWENLKGIITCRGSLTSHLAILAKARGIPAVFGVSEEMLAELSKGQRIIVNSSSGEVITQPTEEQWIEFQEKLQALEAEKKALAIYRTKKTVTLSGTEVKLLANLAGEEEIDLALDSGAEGVGLFRTEFLFMEKKQMPSEAMQEQVYAKLSRSFEGKEVIIRTLDIGGDKQLDYLPMEKEENPFLGHRAIRLCLSNPSLLQTQFRAILKGNVCGNLKIMIPMICIPQELESAKKLFEDTVHELENEGISVNSEIPFGIMVETPAAALTSDLLAKQADFFSIGTNDLIQYTMAADRTNPQVGYLYDPMNPAVLRLIELVIKHGHEAGIPVGICGAAGEHAELVEKLVAWGIDEISMSPDAILRTRKLICEHQ